MSRNDVYSVSHPYKKFEYSPSSRKRPSVAELEHSNSRLARRFTLILAAGAVAVAMAGPRAFATADTVGEQLVVADDVMLEEPVVTSGLRDYSWVDASTFEGMDNIEDKIDLVGEIAQADYHETGVLASVTAAQMIVESALLNDEVSGLAANYNNYFGIKGDPSDSETWRGSTWNGETAYLGTQEEIEGEEVSIDDYFRVYPSLVDSVIDHSSYLANATWDGVDEIYPGIEEINDPATVCAMVAEHYATGSDYADTLMKVIEDYDLTRFDC